MFVSTNIFMFYGERWWNVFNCKKNKENYLRKNHPVVSDVTNY